jgi:hypothetical protein
VSAGPTEGRAPIAPELLRDFNLLINDRLSQEVLRRRAVERKARISLVIAVLALLVSGLLAASFYSGGGPGIRVSSVTAGSVQLVDGTGRLRGRWEVTGDNTARLSLLDDQGTARLRLTLLGSGAQGITLADARGEGRVVLSLEGSEGSRLTFADGAGRPRTVLGLSPQDAGTLIFADADGAPRAAMGLETDGRATFVLPPERSGAVRAAPAADTTGANDQEN